MQECPGELPSLTDVLRLATAHEDDKAVRAAVDLASRRLVVNSRHTEGVFSVSFSADDRTILSASRDETIRLWDVATGKERGVHVGHSGRVWNWSSSPEPNRRSAGADGTVKLWDPNRPATASASNPGSQQSRVLDGRTNPDRF